MTSIAATAIADGKGNDAEGDVPHHSFPDGLLLHRVRRSRQRRFRRAANEPGYRPVGGGVRAWRRAVLHHLCPLRGAEQSGDGEGWSPALDRADHDHVGHRRSMHGAGGRAQVVLSRANAAGGGGGRVLSRRHPLFDLLVPRRIPRPDRRDLHGRDSDFEFPRLADISLVAATRGISRLSRLAVDVRAGGGACGASRHCARSSCCPTVLPMRDGSPMRSGTG